MRQWSTALGIAACGLAFAMPQPVAAQALSKTIAARVEALPIPTLTLTGEQFLKGDASGKPVTVAGALRIAQGSGRLPLVIFLTGSGGFGTNLDVWERQLQEMSISTFALDSLAGRGIASTRQDQSALGLLNMTVDLYRSLAVLAANPRVDPNRIAVMGFSLGGQAALYAGMKRFAQMWNPAGVNLAAHIALYSPCNVTLIGDTEVSDRPIRLFHGISDDFVEIGPCRAYVGRLQKAGKDAKLTEYPDTWHAFDYPNLPPIPIAIANTRADRCALKEEPMGAIINTATGKPLSAQDACIGSTPHTAYSATATHATEAAVKDLLKTAFHLN